MTEAEDGGTGGEEWHFHLWGGVGVFMFDEQVHVDVVSCTPRV
jgi:hypothetical protein